MASQTPTTTTFDDADPRIDYTGPDSSWSTHTGDTQEFRSTSHITSMAGAKASVKFKGSAISVFGTISGETNDGDPTFAPISTYTIDGEKSETYVSLPSVNGMTYGQMFYESGPLDATKEHTLVIMNTATGKNLFRLDYFKVVGASGVDPTLVDSGDGDSTTNGGSTVITHKMVVWAAVGAVLGLLFLLAITVLLFMLVRQKRRRDYAMTGEEPPTYSFWPCKRKKPSKVTPFNYASPSDQTPLQNYPPHRRPLAPRRYPGYDPLDDDEALLALRPAAEREEYPPAYHNLSMRQPPSGSRAAERGSSSSTDDKRPVSEG